ncbi:MAG: DNA polymerase III subunit gamma/tau [Pirellulaceae bacterium]|nr:DNA polymerase III subunit gamma/tau [Pirellulaceae bacterium]
MSNSAAANPADSGEYVVVARRYRPQDFEQLVGQSQVSQALANAITTNRVGHAYLFTGARGVGKTSTARIFSKCLNCVKGPTTTPCGECDMCQGIAAGDDVDVIEIDGASNRGIDEIRQLRGNVNVRPSRARFKIHIIDEVHMLTTPAFNALLKTLEEPPEHVKFIFCTTEADKIPITVLSRCQRFDFAPIETKSILGRLEQICAKEGVTAEPEALQIIARRAAGSMRDSQSLLEQLFSFGGQHITTADIHSMLGTAKSSRLAALAGTLARRDAAAALAEIEAAVGEGVDLGQFTEQLLGYLRDAMAALVGCPADLLLHTAAADVEQVKTFGQQFGLETLLAAAQILDQTLARMRQSTHVRTLVEMALVRICKLEDLDQLPALVAQLRDGTPVAISPRPAATSPPASAPVAASPEKKTTELSASPNLPPISEVSRPAVASPAVPQGATDAPVVPPLDIDSALAAWKETVADLADMTGTWAAKYDSVAISAPNRLVVRFRKAYTTAKEFCERPEGRSRLEETLSRITGRNMRIDFAFSPDEPQTKPSQQVAPRPPVNRRQRQIELMRHPLVKQVVEIFDAEIVGVIDPPPSEAEGGDSPAVVEPALPGSDVA